MSLKVTKNIRIEDLAVELRMISPSIEAAARQTLDLEYMKAVAMSLCPVDTGTLLGTIRVERKSLLESALVAGGTEYTNPKTGKPVDYAKAVHDGTWKMPPRPFLTIAVITERIRTAREILRRTAEAIKWV